MLFPALNINQNAIGIQPMAFLQRYLRSSSLSFAIIPIRVAVHTQAHSMSITNINPIVKLAFAATMDTQPNTAVIAYISNTACF